jgi:DNA mismatch repair ATPase MutS
MFFNWIRLVLNYKVKHKKIYQKKEYSEINFNLLEKITDKQPLSDGYVDNITWHDLELNKVFSKLNRTYTLSGEEMLFYWMKTPTQNSNDYHKRLKKINHVDHKDNDLLKDLDAVGPFDYDYRTEIINTKAKEKRDKKPFLIYGFIFLNLLLFSLTQISIFIFGLCCGIGMLILLHYFFIMNHKYQLATFDYIVRVSKFYKNNRALMNDIYSETHDLRKLDMIMDQFVGYKKSFNRVDGANPLEDIAVALTLSTYKKAHIMEALVALHKNEILSAFDMLGEIDLAQSLHQFKEVSMVSSPMLSEDSQVLKMKESTNILIDDCVENDLEIINSIVITGSNMGGKSSILRQIGINIILAQAFGLSLSKLHEGGYFNVISAISLKDDIESGKSYFLKEAEAIQRMLQQEKKTHHTMILIDEIFKGTNPMERLAASVEILNKLSQENTVIVTTHDISILPDLENYEFYYFEPDISKTSMSFDYKIKKGITEVRNAVKLMEYIEYPQELIQSINQRILSMNSTV